MTKQITRRGFMSALLGAACAPAIVKANNLMKLSAGGIIIPQNAGELVLMDGQTFIKKLAGDFDGDSIPTGFKNEEIESKYLFNRDLTWISFPYNPKLINSNHYKVRSIS